MTHGILGHSVRDERWLNAMQVARARAGACVSYGELRARMEYERGASERLATWARAAILDYVYSMSAGVLRWTRVDTSHD